MARITTWVFCPPLTSKDLAAGKMLSVISEELQA